MNRGLIAIAVAASACSVGAVRAPQSGDTPPPGDRLTLGFTIDRSRLPPLYYKEVTMVVDALGAQGAKVLADGAGIPSAPGSNGLMFTTSGTSIQVQLRDPARPADAGKFTTTLLRGGKKWAFSIGFDDNVNLKASLDGISAMGWRGTLFLICGSIPTDITEESWIESEAAIIRRLDSGWSLGNHSFNHTGVNGDVPGAMDSARRCNQMLEGIAAKSAKPDYKVTAFAAPMFDPAWLPVILAMRDAHDTHLLFDESGGCCPSGAPMVVNPDGNATLWAELMFGFDLTVTRYQPIESDSATAIKDIDARVATVTPQHALWINTLSHGNAESNVLPTMQHIYGKYGPGGTDEVWVAPSDEIYGYLLVQQKARITYTGSR